MGIYDVSRDYYVTCQSNSNTNFNLFYAHLKHENIVKFYDYFEGPNEAFIVTEYLPGGELFAKISSKDYALTESKCRGFARQIFKGVDYIHKVIHSESSIIS